MGKPDTAVLPEPERSVSTPSDRFTTARVATTETGRLSSEPNRTNIPKEQSLEERAVDALTRLEISVQAQAAVGYRVSALGRAGQLIGSFKKKYQDERKNNRELRRQLTESLRANRMYKLALGEAQEKLRTLSPPTTDSQ